MRTLSAAAGWSRLADRSSVAQVPATGGTDDDARRATDTRHACAPIGLAHKIRAYALQEQGLDTIDANTAQGLPVDSRRYGAGAQILTALGAQRLRLMTNNPHRYTGLAGHGLTIVERIALPSAENTHNVRYLRTKQERLGHHLTVTARGATRPTPQAGP